MKSAELRKFEAVNTVNAADGADHAEAWLAIVAQKVKRLDYGTVQVVVHDGRVVYVESNERHRFDVRQSS